MPSSNKHNEILKTKFFLPQPTFDFVDRKLLDAKFENIKTRPLMLVSASTGFGKSTLIANFFSKLNENYAWLSLSEKENEIQQFIKYFITALQSKVQNIGAEVIELTHTPQPPPFDDLAELLVNDIADLNKLFYLAIDDYHLIRNNDVHRFIEKLFEYPQPFFKLIIITRRDPELPLPLWRSKNKLVEIRSADLKFNRTEITEFYEKAISYHPDDFILSKLEEATEGWISGLRMLLLSTNNRDELEQQFLNFKFENSRIISQLVEAILSKQPDSAKDKLLRLSLLKEFNIELFSELCLSEDEKVNKEVLFNEFISAITQSNMFIIALDDKNNWYRFHHLFIEQLQEVLFAEYDQKIVDELNLKAADWFRMNHFPDEAIEHYLNANQVSQALNLFTDYRLKLISETRFHKLERMLKLFPKEVINKSGILLVTNGWILLHNGNILEMANHIEPLDQILKREGHPQELLDLLIGELHAMKTFDRYLANVDLQACLDHCNHAIRLLKDKNPYALGMAWVYYGASMQHLGHPTKAKKEIYKVLENTDNEVMKGLLLLILCFLDWFEGDLTNMIKTAEHLLQLGHDSGIKMLIANGNILAGMPHYYNNNDEKASEYLLESYNLRHFTYLHMSFSAGMALADIYAKKGELKEMDAVIQAYEATALKQGGNLFNKITRSASAEFAWRYQKDLSGLKWAKENDYKDFLPLANLFAPEIVQARILALDDDPASHSMAQDILDIMIPFFEARNDFNVLIRALVIQALLYHKCGDTDNAFGTIQKVVNLSSVGHYVRPYVELGEPMKNLLLAYKKTVKNSSHIDEILQHFIPDGKAKEKIFLTIREKEILVLAHKMTNKEVGNQLFISEKTVKVHITNINKKLKVNSKLDAIAKAKELTLI